MLYLIKKWHLGQRKLNKVPFVMYALFLKDTYSDLNRVYRAANEGFSVRKYKLQSKST